MKEYAIELENVNLKYKFYKSAKIKQELLKLIKRTEEKRLNEIWALRNLSFKIEKGETVGIIGTNGAGKTTLLKTIAQIFKPDSGEVILNADSVSLLALGTGFQGELSGIENIYLNGLLLGLNKNQIDNKLQDIIDFSGLKDFIFNPIKTYSSGMKSRLAFSIASYIEPDILLIDEVLGVGDAHFKEKSSRRINELIKDKRTVVLVSHSMNDIKQMCNKVIWLEKGNLMGVGDPKEMIASYLEYVKMR